MIHNDLLATGHSWFQGRNKPGARRARKPALDGILQGFPPGGPLRRADQRSVVVLEELGIVQVQRASHVEDGDRRQRWTVRPTVQTVTNCHPVVRQSRSRAHALAWEHENFQPGGPYRPQLTSPFNDHSDRSPSDFQHRPLSLRPLFWPRFPPRASVSSLRI